MKNKKGIIAIILVIGIALGGFAAVFAFLFQEDIESVKEDKSQQRATETVEYNIPHIESNESRPIIEDAELELDIEVIERDTDPKIKDTVVEYGRKEIDGSDNEE